MLLWLFLSLLTHFSRCPQVHSFLFTIKVFHGLHLPYGRSCSAAADTPCSAKEGLQLWSPEDALTLEPVHAFPPATLPEWKQSTQTLTHPSLQSFQTPSCSKRCRTLAVDQARQVTRRLCPSGCCQVPAVPFNLPLLPINQPNEPTSTSVNP